MPTFSPPRNDTARAAFLKTASAAAQNDYTKGNKYLLHDTFEMVVEYAPEFETKATSINQKLSARSKEIEEGNSALAELSTYTRDAMEALRRLVSRTNQPAHVLSMHGLPLDGTTPNPATATEWLTIARTFVEGAQKAQVEGHPVVGCPTPAEIKKVLDKAAKEYADVSAADRGYDEAQADMADMRKKADELIGDLMAELRLTLRKMDMPSQRRIMRTYGARYQYLQGEPVDQGDTEPITAQEPAGATA